MTLKQFVWTDAAMPMDEHNEQQKPQSAVVLIQSVQIHNILIIVL